MFHHAKKNNNNNQGGVFSALNRLMNQNTNGMNFEVIDDNNKSESDAKNDIFRGTANYITTKNTFSL